MIHNFVSLGDWASVDIISVDYNFMLIPGSLESLDIGKYLFFPLSLSLCVERK